MSADLIADGEDKEPARVRQLRAASLDRVESAREQAEIAAGNETPERTRTELASENAALHKRIGTLESQVKDQQDRFSAWAKEMAVREDVRAVRDEAQGKRERALADRVAELERRLDERSDATDPGGPESRLDRQEPVGRQAGKREPERLWRTNEAIGVYVAGGGTLLSAYADSVGTGMASDVVGIAGNLAGFAAAAIALTRKRREGSDAHRPEG